MPKALGEFLNDLAQKAGVSSDNEHLKSLLASPELVNIKVPDELTGSLDKGLINIDQAKNNHPDIKNKYFADAFDGMDKNIVTLLTDVEDILSPEDILDIKNEKSTTKKMGLAISKLKAAKVKANPKDKEEINKQLADLNESLRLEKESKKQLAEQYEGKIKDIHLSSALKAQFANYKTIYDELPNGVKPTSMEAMIKQALQDNNAVLTVDDNGTLQILKKDGTNVFGSDNRPVTPQSFLDKTFAPILKVSTPPRPAQTTQPSATAPAADATTDFVQSHNSKVLQEMSKSSAPMI